MDNLGTDARGRGKVDFAQVVKVAKSARLVHSKILMLNRLSDK